MADRRGQNARLEERVSQLEQTANRGGWKLFVYSGLATLLTGMIINSVGPLVEAAVSDKPNPCSVQYEAVDKAVQSGVTDQKNLDALAEPGCSIKPHEVASDIQE